MILSKTKLLCLLILINNCFFSQSNNSHPDIWMETWASGKFCFKLNKKLKFNIKEQLRTKFSNLYEIEFYERSYSEIEFENTLRNKISWGISYRHIIKSHDFKNSIIQYNRYNYFFSKQLKLGEDSRLHTNYKVQYQRRRERIPETSKHVGQLIKYWRLKTELSYNFKNWKLDPKIGVEFFFRGNDHPSNQYNKYRFSLETICKINNLQYISIKYMFEKQYKKWNPEIIHIICLQYNYSIKY